MIARRQVIGGSALGIAVAAVVLCLAPAWRDGRPQGVVLSECDGRLRELVIQYEPGGRQDILPVFAQFLPQLDEDVTVWAVCPDAAAFDELREAVGQVRCLIRPVIAGHAMTSWARDRWVALDCKDGTVRLVCPSREAAAGAWPARAGDERVAEDLAREAPGVASQRSELYFDGGDILATGHHALIMPRVLPRNAGRTVADAVELRQRMAALLGRPVAVLDEAPDHHAAMFMMPAGDGVMLVGDPSIARGQLAAAGSAGAPAAFADLPGGADFSTETQRLFDRVAEQCRELGYRVERIPTVPAGDGRTYITFTNALVDAGPNRRIVYMPTYRGAEVLNEAAASVWRRLGYEVRSIDCTRVYRHFGCLHCLVNVLRRG